MFLGTFLNNNYPQYEGFYIIIYTSQQLFRFNLVQLFDFCNYSFLTFEYVKYFPHTDYGIKQDINSHKHFGM